MRTSRIQGITSSVFRNSRQYLQTNERVFRLMDEGQENRQRPGQQQNNGNEKQENALQKESVPVKLLKKNGKSLVVKGIQSSDANSMTDLHNSLLKKTAKLNQVSKESQMRTYRSSI